MACDLHSEHLSGNNKSFVLVEKSQVCFTPQGPADFRAKFHISSETKTQTGRGIEMSIYFEFHQLGGASKRLPPPEGGKPEHTGTEQKHGRWYRHSRHIGPGDGKFTVLKFD